MKCSGFHSLAKWYAPTKTEISRLMSLENEIKSKILLSLFPFKVLNRATELDKNKIKTKSLTNSYLFPLKL